MLLYCKFQKDRDYILVFFISRKAPSILPCPCCWMDETVNKYTNKWKQAQGKCLYSRMRIKMANLNSIIQSSLFFPTSSRSRVGAHVSSLHHTEVPAWGLVGLTSAWALSPGIRMHPPGQKAPRYNLHKGSMCAGRSRPHFGIMSSLYSECCVIYCP